MLSHLKSSPTCLVLVLTLVLLSTASAQDQFLELVKDSNTEQTMSSDPVPGVVHDEELYFAAFDVSTGTELWKTDGTDVGTVLIKDIYTGTGGSFPGNMVVFDLAEPGNFVAARPSGTEPKVKFYLFTFVPPELLADLQDAREEMAARLDAMQADLAAFAEKLQIA